MKAMMFLIAFLSLIVSLASGSPAIAARQSVSNPLSPTDCPVPTVPTGGSWMAAATNIAAIPTGLLTPCQLGCLANDHNCNYARIGWVRAFKQTKESNQQALCFDNFLTGGYYTSNVQACGSCLAEAQFLANKASPPAHPVPDLLDFENGLAAQLLNGIDTFCFNSTGDAQALEEFMCLGRDLMREFGVPVDFFNFTISGAPELAWNAVTPIPTSVGIPSFPGLPKGD